jgi:hypothetical protein
MLSAKGLRHVNTTARAATQLTTKAREQAISLDALAHCERYTPLHCSRHHYLDTVQPKCFHCHSAYRHLYGSRCPDRPVMATWCIRS